MNNIYTSRKHLKLDICANLPWDPGHQKVSWEGNIKTHQKHGKHHLQKHWRITRFLTGAHWQTLQNQSLILASGLSLFLQYAYEQLKGGPTILDSTLFALPVPSCPILDFWRPSGFRTRMLCPPRRYCSVSLIKCDQTDSTWLQGKCKSREHLHIQIGFQLQDPNALNTFRACIVIWEGLQNQMLVKQLELFIQHPCVSIRNLEVVHQLNHFWFQGLRRCQGLQMTHGGWNSLDAWAQVPCPELCSLHTSTPRMARKAKTKSSSNSSTLLTSREKKLCFICSYWFFKDKPTNQWTKPLRVGLHGLLLDEVHRLSRYLWHWWYHARYHRWSNSH